MFFAPERGTEGTDATVSLSYLSLLAQLQTLFQNQLVQREKCTFLPGACTVYGMGY